MKSRLNFNFKARFATAALVAILVIGALATSTLLRADSQECYVAQWTICDDTCFNTGGWWHCEPLLPADFEPGFCDHGSRYCAETEVACDVRLSCDKPPLDMGQCPNPNKIKSCHATGEPKTKGR